MKDNLSIVITMLIFVILIVIFPLYNYFERQDDMSYNLVLKATTNFVEEVLEAGYLDQEMYNKYIDEISNTGNIYDVELEAHRKVLIKEDPADASKYSEEYLINYNHNIFDESSGDVVSNIQDKVIKGNAYYFNEGDKFYVKTKNSNTTMAGAIFNAIVPTSSKDRVSVNYGGIVKNQAWAKVDATYRGHNVSSSAPIVTSNPTTVLTDQQVNPGTTVTFTAEANVINWWASVEKFVWIIKNTETGDTSLSAETRPPSGDPNKTTYTITPPQGTYTMEVYAVDGDGVRSDSFASLFIAKTLDSIYSGSVTGMIFDKTIFLENIDDFYVDSITFDLYINGHSSSNGDKWYIKGIIGKDGSGNYIYGTDIVPVKWVSNGTGSYTVSGLADKKYKGVQLYYQVKASHANCLNNTSRLNYSVKYKYYNN